MNRGYVKLWRKTKDSPVFAHEGLLKLFILCILKANHKPADVIIPGILKPIHLEPGQFITGRESLWEDYHQLHLKKKPRRKPTPHAITVFRWLLTLQDMSILHIKSYNKYSIITVLNWIQYQQNEQQMHINCTSNVHKQEYSSSKEPKNGVVFRCGFFSVDADRHEKYERAYPGLNFQQEYSQMETWLTDNPSKRPKSQWGRFINSWLHRNHKELKKNSGSGWKDKLKHF